MAWPGLVVSWHGLIMAGRGLLWRGLACYGVAWLAMAWRGLAWGKARLWRKELEHETGKLRSAQNELPLMLTSLLLQIFLLMLQMYPRAPAGGPY